MGKDTCVIYRNNFINCQLKIVITVLDDDVENIIIVDPYELGFALWFKRKITGAATLKDFKVAKNLAYHI